MKVLALVVVLLVGISCTPTPTPTPIPTPTPMPTPSASLHERLERDYHELSVMLEALSDRFQGCVFGDLTIEQIASGQVPWYLDDLNVVWEDWIEYTEEQVEASEILNEAAEAMETQDLRDKVLARHLLINEQAKVKVISVNAQLDSWC